MSATVACLTRSSCWIHQTQSVLLTTATRSNFDVCPSGAPAALASLVPLVALKCFQRVPQVSLQPSFACCLSLALSLALEASLPVASLPIPAVW